MTCKKNGAFASPSVGNGISDKNHFRISFVLNDAFIILLISFKIRILAQCLGRCHCCEKVQNGNRNRNKRRPNNGNNEGGSENRNNGGGKENDNKNNGNNSQIPNEKPQTPVSTKE